MTLVISIIPFVLHPSIAESLGDIQMKSTNLYDNAVGRAMGWTPDGEKTFFNIEDGLVEYGVSTILINIGTASNTIETDPVCQVSYVSYGGFTIKCDTPPPEYSELYYTVFHQTPKVISQNEHYDEPYPDDDDYISNETSSFKSDYSKDAFQNITSDRFQNNTN
ncbi:MAG: hypothetical protein K0S93_202 [Nitrososphaeraceae archaeon]|nr:hypothetical protein [Nitrososphaeraceae archaeon]